MKTSIITSLLLLSALSCNASEVNPLRLDTIELIPALCIDPGSTATVTLDATGGVPPYSYMIDGQANDTEVFTDVDAGQHIFSVIDHDGTVVTTTITTGPSPLSLVRVSQAPDCADRYELGIISFEIEGENLNSPVNTLSDGQTITEAHGNFAHAEAGTYTVISSNLASPDCPDDSTSIQFALIIPQASGNDIEDFINAKYCIPCVN